MRESDRAVFWRNHVDALRQQGGLQSDYCHQNGLTPRELRKWRTRFYGPARRKRSLRTEDLRSNESGLSEFSYAPEVLAKGPEAAPGRPVVRRRWSDDEKRQLVWDALNSGQSLSQFAKRLHIHPSVMHRWLCTLTRPVLAEPPTAEPAFAGVRIADVALHEIPGFARLSGSCCT